jgi:signal transduction histidine kinase
MTRTTRYQLSIVGAALLAVLYIRLTRFRGGSPFELFLLLNILLAIVVRTPVVLTAAVSGFAASHLVMVVEGRWPRRYAVMAVTYVVLSAILVFLNHRWHSSRSRAETQRLAYERQREQLLSEAQAANRAKDHLLANVSHELRTPLNAISGWATMISRGMTRSDEDVRRAAEVIKRNAEILTKHVDELLDVSLVATGRVRMHVSPVAIGRVVRGVVESVTPQAAARGVTLASSVSPDVGAIQGDHQRLEQVLLALLSNAIKFTHPGGKVAVSAANDGGDVVIDVTDSGIGIAPDFLPHVFDRFSQADPSTTRKHGGIGLGLSIAKHLVELMGGEIAASSGGQDRGTTFTLRFPQSLQLADVSRLESV